MTVYLLGSKTNQKTKQTKKLNKIKHAAERPTEKSGAILTRVRVPVMKRDFSPRVNSQRKLLTLVYDILPSTTAVFSFAIGSRKLSANEQFLVGAQTV